MKPLREQPEFIEMLRKYSPPGQDLPELLCSKEDRIRSGDLIVPFLGMQGMGKSTLLNALLGEDLLPVEADETTCVPVEMRYGTEPHAEVRFLDGTPVRAGSLGRQELSSYVDNNENPGNEKNVERIVLYRDNPLLETGIVVVDLPGVGSLTRANEETTKQYIRDLCAAVFLISESPPIGRDTAAFLKSVWGSITKAFFVQNVWDGDSEEEKQEGLHHNRIVLEDIAEQIHVPKDVQILPVNAYQAAFGAFRCDSSLVNDSGLPTVLNTLTDFARNYKAEMEREFSQQVGQAAEVAALQAEELIRQSEMTGQEVMREMETRRAEFERTSEEIRDLTDGIDRELKRAGRKVRKAALEIATHYAGLAFSDTCQTIEAGVVDGDQLSRVVMDNQANRGREATEAAFNEIQSVWQPVEEKFQEIGELISEERFRSPAVSSFDSTEEAKWEDGVAIAVDIGGAAGGVWLGVAAVPILEGAISGAWAGPIGIGIGIAVAGLATLIGSSIRKNKQLERAGKAKHAVQEVCDQFRERIRAAIEQSWEETAQEAQRQLQAYAEERRQVLAKMEDEIREFQERGMKLERSRAEMERDAACLRERSRYA